MYEIKQSTAITVPFFVHDAAGDAVTGLSDGSFTKRISKGSGSFGAMTVTITEMENGWYSIPLSTSHSDTLGLLSITFTNAGAKQVNLQWRVEAKLIDDLNDFNAGSDTVALVTDVTTKTGYAVSATGLDLVLENSTFNIASSARFWNEVLTGATFNINNSSGKRLRDVASNVIRTNTAQGAGTGNNQIQFDTGASAVDGIFDPGRVLLSSGTGVGQARLIIEYDGTTKTATVDRDWKVNPDATTEFIIIADAGREHVNEGLAQAGTTTTITLNVLAASIDDSLVGQIVFIRSGIGQDQVRNIIAYNGTTKVATVNKDWDTTPTTGSGYVILPAVNLTDQQIADIVWDEPLTGATHNVMQSSGKRLRDLGGFAIRSGTAQGAGTGNNQIQFDTGASSVDGAYDPAAVLLVGGTQDGQTRLILQYDGATRTATVDRNWKVNPTASTEFVIVASAGREHVNEGLSQGGTSTTITLNTLAASFNSAYNGQTVFIRSGTGDDQARRIVSYNGSTKVATVDSSWDVTPDTTSAYVMLPTALRSNQEIADAIWDETLSGHTTAGTTGKAITDTETDVNAIKVKTDKLTFTSGNDLDANIQKVNDVTVTGTGANGDEWGP